MINPRRMIPKQVNRTAFRLCLLYWLSIVAMRRVDFFRSKGSCSVLIPRSISVLVPYNSTALKDALANGNGMGRSIFIVGLESFGMHKGFRHFANAMLITSGMSACTYSLWQPCS